MRKLFLVCIFLLAQIPPPVVGGDQPELAARFMTGAMSELEAYRMLSELTGIGARPAGSRNAEAAVQWARETMLQLGLDNVRLEPVTVPHWVRGDREEAHVVSNGESFPLSVTALGGSIATPESGVSAEVVEVRSLDEVKQLGESVRGKIVFYNGPMDPTHLNTFQAYGGAHEQRTKGPAQASLAGAVAALVRSLTLARDDLPHTGGMRFEAPAQKIPAAALGTLSADRLSALLKKDPKLTVTLHLSGTLIGEAPSANVIGEIRGSEKPDEIVLIGAHLDSWDKGTGAHDDGAGCVHVLEAMRLIKKAGLKPKRTIRAVLFMNEEFGLSGARAYAAVERPAEQHIVAIETDAGGFSPRGFSVEAKGAALQRILGFAPRLRASGGGDFREGHAGADISVLTEKGVPGIGLSPDSQRYFDYHHSDADTLDKVNPRELELGAVNIATLSAILADEL